MNSQLKKAAVTATLLAALGAVLFYSFEDKQAANQTQAQLRQQIQIAAQTVELTGLISLDVEPFFKDERVIKILAEHNFKPSLTRVGSRDMAARAVKDTAPDFFMPSGVVAANQIGDAAKKAGYTTASYSPYYTPMVIASWVPVAKLLAANGIASPVEGGKGKVYELQLAKLIDAMQAKKRWRDFANAQDYDVGRSVLVSTTDPRTSNSGAMYLALTSYALNQSEVVSDKEAARRIALQVADLFKRQGYQESFVNGNFDDYVVGGMGKSPLAFIYENQLAAYAIGRKALDPNMTLMYPRPTVFNKVMLVALRPSAKPFAELLSSHAGLQAIATEYGFRTSNTEALPKAAAGAGLAVKASIVDVIDPPSFEIMAEMLAVVAEQMKS